jgi:hypothetical protein
MVTEVLLALGVAVLVELGLRITDVSTVARLCGVRLDLTSPSAVDPPPLTLPTRVRRQVRAVDHVMRRWPFGDTCLRRCLVLGQRVRAVDPVLRIGVALGPGEEFRAHAWLEVGGHVLNGEVGSFIAFGEIR